METIDKTMIIEKLNSKSRSNVENAKLLASVAGLDDSSHVSMLAAITRLKIDRDHGMYPWLQKAAVAEIALDFLWFDPGFSSRLDLNPYQDMYFKSVANDILREIATRNGLDIDVDVGKKSLKDITSDISDGIKQNNKDLSKKMIALRSGIKVRKIDAPGKNTKVADVNEKMAEPISYEIETISTRRSDGETISIITSGPIQPPVNRKVLVLLDLNHIFTYTYSEHLPFSIESFMSRVIDIVKKDNTFIQVDDVVGHIFCSGHLFHLNRELKIYAGRSTEKKFLDFCNSFKWTTVNMKKIDRGTTKSQDVDTYIAVTGTEEILSREFEMERLYLISGDKDMLPIVDLARRKNIKITVASYKKVMSRDLSCLADNVVFFD